ncbi:MAG: type II toxin-antitoxin system VapC family toxin [Spirochaetaceae bacterium]|nr:type II toxin-antitoxin system VapC family toxin [Spirochaetaceae bacterium]MDE0221882.1 type II toxin-antitoxin system VapC family toxin [Spirochaetaceae bacterium]
MNRYLLDTCTFIWLCTEPQRLSATATEAIDAPETVLLWSDVSALEIALKWSAGKIILPDPPRHWIEQQIAAWSMDCLRLQRNDIYRASELPALHRDPFDRLLVAAALGATATILTPDDAIHAYPVSCRW